MKGILGFVFNRFSPPKISIRNIIVMIGGAEIKEKEPYVKALRLERLIGYITYFKPLYTDEEVENLVRKFI